MNHILGTDTKGRDTLARIMQGGLTLGGIRRYDRRSADRRCLWINFGYIGGKFDAFMMRLVDILYALPFLIFVILLISLDFDHQLILIFIAIERWSGYTARIVRGHEQHQEYGVRRGCSSQQQPRS